MKYVKTIGKLGLALALGLVCHGAGAAQLVSSLPPTAAAGVTAGGESVLQAVTPDGRFVLFASTANNLALTTNQTGSPFPQVPHLNLYRRDRQVGTNVMVSAALTGGAGTGDSVGGDISSNGNWVVFMSTAVDLVAGDTNGVTDVFVRSLDTGATTLVSVSTNGGCANGASRNPVMTPDGRYVAFVSAAANMVAGDTNGLEDVFVRDLQSGETRLVSVGAKSALPVSASGAPQISADGRYVAFMSSATNLVPTVRTTYEIYLRDLQLNQTVWVSGGAHALMWSQTNNSSGVFYNIALSDDGQYVAFEGCTLQSPFKAFILRYHLQTDVTDLISSTNVFKEAFTINTYSELPEDYRSLSMSPDGQYIAFVAAATNGANTCVMMWDSLTGTNTLVSELVNGLGTTNTVCLLPEVAPSGRYVAFLSSDPNLVTNRVSDDYQLYCRDVQEGRTLLISADTNGVGLGVDCLCQPRFSAAGLAFDSAGGGFVPLDFNHAGDVFVRNLTNDTVELVSARDAGLPSRATGVAGSKFSLSADGRYLAFASAADGLVPGDTNGLRDIYVRDLEADTITLVSVSTNGFTAGNGASAEPVISGDGRYVAFSSLANDLTADDPDNLRDVFVRDLVTGNTVNVSANLDNTTFSEFSGLQMDAGGRHILFGDSGQQTIHLMDLQSLLVTNLPTANAAAVAMSPNGRYILYYPGFSIMQRVGIWDSEVSTIIWSNALQTPFVASAIPMGISPDGLKVAYQDGASLQGLNRNSGEHWVWAAGQSGYSTGLRFSIDSRYMVYACTNGIVAADTNLLSDVYLFDFDTGSNRLVSTTSASGCGNGASTAPDLSADGRYVVFRSAASNLVTDDTNGLPDIFLLDRTTAKLTCLTQAPGAAGSAADRAVTAKFSPDGHSLVLQTWADNLTPGDFDQAGDLLAVNFLYAKLDGSMTPGSLSWLVTPGINYHVEYSDLLSAPDWKPLSGTVSITGNRGRINDPHPAVSQRWYRVVAEQQ